MHNCRDCTYLPIMGTNINLRCYRFLVLNSSVNIKNTQ